jgi:hypothetical protein
MNHYLDSRHIHQQNTTLATLLLTGLTKLFWLLLFSFSKVKRSIKIRYHPGLAITISHLVQGGPSITGLSAKLALSATYASSRVLQNCTKTLRNNNKKYFRHVTSTPFHLVTAWWLGVTPVTQ